MMTIALFVKKDDAAIIQVKGGADALVANDVAPRLAVFVDVFDDEHGLRVTLFEQ